MSKSNPRNGFFCRTLQKSLSFLAFRDKDLKDLKVLNDQELETKD